jgi:hypothetical protein
MTWAAFWNALQQNGALPSAALTLLVVGASFRWYEQLCHFLGRRGWGLDPFVTTANHVAKLRAAGDEPTARRVEERIQDQRRRMTRCGQAMMVVGVVTMVLSLLLL